MSRLREEKERLERSTQRYEVIREEQELKVKALRERQEKANDRQAEIDALRAKRAFEESER